MLYSCWPLCYRAETTIDSRSFSCRAHPHCLMHFLKESLCSHTLSLLCTWNWTVSWKHFLKLYCGLNMTIMNCMALDSLRSDPGWRSPSAPGLHSYIGVHVHIRHLKGPPHFQAAQQAGKYLFQLVQLVPSNWRQLSCFLTLMVAQLIWKYFPLVLTACISLEVWSCAIWLFSGTS